MIYIFSDLQLFKHKLVIILKGTKNNVIQCGSRIMLHLHLCQIVLVGCPRLIVTTASERRSRGIDVSQKQNLLGLCSNINYSCIMTKN